MGTVPAGSLLVEVRFLAKCREKIVLYFSGFQSRSLLPVNSIHLLLLGSSVGNEKNDTPFVVELLAQL